MTTDWHKTKLGLVSSIRYGLGVPPASLKDGVPMIRATNVKRGRIVSNGLMRICLEDVPHGRNAILHEGDIIVVRSGAYTGDSALVTAEWAGSVAGYDLIVSPTDSVDSAYLSFWLLGETAQMYFRGQRDRSAQPHLNRQQLGEAELTLPPLQEQQQIATVLSAVQRAIERQERLIALTTELKKALMHKLFTEGTRGEPLKQTEVGPVPQSWSVATIGDLLKFSSGKSRPKETEEAWSEEKPYPVFGGNGVMGFATQYLLDRPVLVIGRVGVYCGCAHHTDGAAWISDNALYAKWIDGRIDTRYAREFFEFANLNKHSTRAAQPLVTQGILSGIKIPLPMKEEQHRIQSALATLTQKIEQHRRAQNLLTSLFRALIHQLMTAQVRVHDLDLSALEAGEAAGGA